jgi:hypothetical protein
MKRKNVKEKPAFHYAGTIALLNAGLLRATTLKELLAKHRKQQQKHLKTIADGRRQNTLPVAA